MLATSGNTLSTQAPLLSQSAEDSEENKKNHTSFEKIPQEIFTRHVPRNQNRVETRIDIPSEIVTSQKLGLETPNEETSMVVFKKDQNRPFTQFFIPKELQKAVFLIRNGSIPQKEVNELFEKLKTAFYKTYQQGDKQSGLIRFEPNEELNRLFQVINADPEIKAACENFYYSFIKEKAIDPSSTETSDSSVDKPNIVPEGRIASIDELLINLIRPLTPAEFCIFLFVLGSSMETGCSNQSDFDCQENFVPLAIGYVCLTAILLKLAAMRYHRNVF